MVKLQDPIDNLAKKDKIIFDKMLKKRNHIDEMYRYMMNYPKLTKQVSHLGAFLRYESILKDNTREFIILYISRKLNIMYEWVHHVKLAKKAKLTNEIIKQLQIKDFQKIEEPYKKLIKTINIILNLKIIPEKLQNELIKIYGVKGIIEIVTLVGFYQMIAGIIISFDVPLPKGTKKPW